MKTRIIRLLTTLVGLCSIVVLFRVIAAFTPPKLYKKDYVQFYLMGKAALAHLPVYTPIPELAARFNPLLGNYHWHPSAYPPPVVFLVAPFCLLPYVWALAAWTLVEVVCFASSSALVLRHFGGWKAPAQVLITILLIVLWGPFYDDLYHGQIMMLALLLLIGSWLCLRQRRDLAGGILLGLLLALKLYAWPISLFLLIQKRYRAVFAASAIFLAMNLLAMLWLGVNQVTDYYLRVGPAIGVIYRNHPINFSALAVGADFVGLWAGAALAILLLIVALMLAFRVRNFDHAFMIMLASSVVLSPVSWTHYLITLLPAFCLIASWRDITARECVFAALLVCASMPDLYDQVFPPILLRILPLLFITGLMLFIVRPFRYRPDLAKKFTDSQSGSRNTDFAK